jgi:DNA-binding response OmpR family regulator
MICKVVSVEDEPEIAELLRVVLDNPEIELVSEDNGTDGLALIRSLHPDLIMLDVMLPGELNGWDVYDAIRADPELTRTPIIMLTVLPEEPDRRRAFRGSAIDMYITKPFDALRLRSEVERLLGRRGLWRPPQPHIARAFGIHAPDNTDDRRAPPSGPSAGAPERTDRYRAQRSRRKQARNRKASRPQSRRWRRVWP